MEGSNIFYALSKAQLNPAHYRSLDYTLQVRVSGRWTTVVTVRDNSRSGWIAHDFPDQTTPER